MYVSKKMLHFVHKLLVQAITTTINIIDGRIVCMIEVITIDAERGAINDARGHVYCLLFYSTFFF